MSKLSEQEIIDQVQNIKRELNGDTHKINTNFNKAEVIQSLLDLYNKEKEKNKELLEERKSYTEEYIHNNPWLYKQLNELYVFKTDVEKDYISKDKIKEKIKELEEFIESKRILPLEIIEEQNKNAKYKIEVLLELLQ